MNTLIFFIIWWFSLGFIGGVFYNGIEQYNSYKPHWLSYVFFGILGLFGVMLSLGLIVIDSMEVKK